MRKVDFERVYDLAFDLASFRVRRDFKHFQTVEVDEGFYIDFDVGGCPVAIEIIKASKKFSMLAGAFDDVKIEGTIKITEKVIRIEMKIPKFSRFLEKEVSNDYGICDDEISFETG